MAYITQYEADMTRDAKQAQQNAQLQNGLQNAIGQWDTSRQRALAEKRQKEQDVKQQQNEDLAYSAQGHSAESINNFRQTGDMNQMIERNNKIYEANKAKTLSDADLERRVKESTINKNNRAPIDKNAAKGTVAEQAVDRNFGKTYEDFIVGGGYSKVGRGLKSLQEVSDKLGNENGPNLTGGIIGRMPDWVQSATGNSDAVEARDQVGTIIQDNLRAILGPAYTEREGENVIRRAYDPTLSEAANKKKLDGVIGQMSAAAKSKIEAAKHFEQHGSMRGYKGTQINNVDDIFKEAQPAGSEGEKTPAAKSSKKPWEKY